MHEERRSQHLESAFGPDGGGSGGGGGLHLVDVIDEQGRPYWCGLRTFLPSSSV
jgi:hypothetical protein